MVILAQGGWGRLSISMKIVALQGVTFFGVLPPPLMQAALVFIFHRSYPTLNRPSFSAYQLSLSVDPSLVVYIL